MKQRKVVVGGGIAGICTALFLAEKGDSVTLIEKGPALGGLLRSIYPFGNEYCFDFGTHFLAQTANKKLNELLFGNLDLQWFDYLKVGSFYSGLFEGNGFVTDFHLAQKDEYFDQIDFNQKQPSENLNQQLVGSFGMGYTKNLLDPILKKFYGNNSKDLAVNAHHLFGLNRIIVKDKETTDRLKSSNKVYDDLLAFHSYKQGLSSRKALYPKNGGVGKWIDYLISQLHFHNVEILTNSTINKINYDLDTIKSITVNNETFALERLIWTAPSSFIYPFFSIQKKSTLERLSSHLIHFVVDKDYLTDLYYFQCFNPDLKTFRVTLYDNFSPKCHEKNRRITVEVLVKKKEEILPDLPKTIFEELVSMQVIPSTTSVVHQMSKTIPNSFPILKKSKNQVVKPEKSLTERFSNLNFFGKAYSKKWFMSEVIGEIYDSINEEDRI